MADMPWPSIPPMPAPTAVPGAPPMAVPINPPIPDKAGDRYEEVDDLELEPALTGARRLAYVLTYFRAGARGAYFLAGAFLV